MRTTKLAVVCLTIWLSSTDKSAELNAAISLNLSTPEYGSCGQVRINGGVALSSGTIARISWDWGDGAIIDSFFAAAHTYSRNGAYEIKVTAYSNTGETQTAASSVTISNAEDPACKFSTRLHPATVFLRNGRTSQALGSPVQGSNSAYVEGLASAMGVYAARRMREVPGQYGIPESILTEILKQNWWRPNQKPDLDRYVANGSRYSSIDANIIDDMVVTLADQYGTAALYRFFSVFLPSDSQYSFLIDTDAKQATFFVTAWSAATGEDLRTRFRQSWGFPIDDAFYASISSEVRKLVLQRDPAAYAGKNIEVAAGQNVTLSEAEGFDWEDDALRFSWKIVSQVPGSVASFSDASALHPAFRADRPGQYVLSVTASDGLVTGSASTVTVEVKPAVQPQTFSWILPSSARAAGATEGVFYTTDLTIANTGPTDAAITLKFLGNNQDGRTGIEKNVQLAAGKSVSYVDVLRSVFTQESGYGAIQIRSSVADLAILSRTSTPGSGGTFGQSVPAFASGDTIAQGSR